MKQILNLQGVEPEIAALFNDEELAKLGDEKKGATHALWVYPDDKGGVFIRTVPLSHAENHDSAKQWMEGSPIEALYTYPWVHIHGRGEDDRRRNRRTISLYTVASSFEGMSYDNTPEAIRKVAAGWLFM